MPHLDLIGLDFRLMNFFNPNILLAVVSSRSHG